ncbi:MAG: peptidylprolyl isomerase [Planctomycetes bacterium]|nr:peptidylprolyl isomerase [Planctomycetota bacterium]
MRAAVALTLLLACAPARAEEDARTAALRQVIELEDLREASPEAWRPLVLHEDEVVRGHAVRGAGRTRDPALAPLLREALAASSRLGRTPRSSVERGEVAFALGLCPDPASVDVLLALAHDPVSSVRASAIASLGRHGPAVPVSALLFAFRDETIAPRDAALLAVCRLRGRRAAIEGALHPAVGERLLAALHGPMESRVLRAGWQLPYAAMDLDALDGPGTSRLDLLTRLSITPLVPEARLFLARALGAASGPGPERARLALDLLGPRHPHVAAAAAASIARIGSDCGDHLGDAAARLAGLARLHVSPDDFHARRAAVVALTDLAALPGHDEVRLYALPAARAALDDPSPSVRIDALVALVRLDPGAAEQVAARAGHAQPLDRLAAARAARHLPAAARDPLLERLRQDPDVRVACEALTLLGALAGEDEDARARAVSAARAAVRHGDLAVRATGVSLLGEHGGQDDVATIAAVASSSPGADLVEVRVECVGALKALAGREVAPALPALRAALADEAPAVRKAAAEALTALTGEAITLPPAKPTRSTVALEPADLLREGPNPWVDLRTTKGTIRVVLLWSEAPRHVKGFLARARAGFYDGLRFHRVVTGFVVQGLDPRGDGWGSGGVLVKDEINPVPFLAGAVGMPNAGPDTGGCQLFITHVPTPHLDGSYTVFGRVVAGMDVVHALDLDDVCERVQVLDDR